MNGITFGDYHSWDDFDLILSPDWEIEAPTPKTEYVDIPGGDGVLDFTEAFGEVKYNNRKLTFPFSTIVPRSEFWDLFSHIQNMIHGRKLHIVIDSDPGFYYVGRITVDKWKADRNIGTITVECDCEPYKYKINKTVRQDMVEGTTTLIYPNLRKSVVPTIVLTGDASITFNGTTYAVPAGRWITESEFVFTEGNNILTVTPVHEWTTIMVEYQEGEL